MKKKIITFLIIIIYIKSWSQKVNSVWYNTENGLPQNSIKDIIKDKYGFVWISTENGILKFDGLSFTCTNSNLLKNNSFADFGGNVKKDSLYSISALWDDEILINQRKVKYNITHKNERPILINGTTYYLLRKKVLKDIRYLANYFIKLNKDIYFLSYKKITHNSIDLSKKINFQLDEDYFNNIFCDKDNLYIISKTHKKIIKINSGKITYQELPSFFLNKANRIYWSQVNNQTLIIRNQEIYKLDFTKKIPTPIKILDYKFEESDFSSVFYDEENLCLYIGTITSGLNVIKKSNFYTVLNTNNVDNYFYANLPFGNDNVITPKGIIYNKEKSFAGYDFKNSDRYLMFQDSDKNILFRKDTKILKFHKKSNYKTYNEFEFSKTVDYLGLYNNKFVVAAHKDYVNNKSYLIIYSNGEFKNPSESYVFPSVITVVKFKSKNECLVGTRNGLYVISKNNKVPYKIKGTNNINIREIINTKDGNFWIMTQGKGFFLLNGNKIIKMPNDENNSLLYSHNLIEDDKGFFWISTNNGLFKILKKHLIEYALKKRTSVHFYRYSKEDGFATNEFNGGCFPSVNKLSNGNFVFPSMKGLVFFNPNEIKSFYPKNFYIKTVRFSENKSQLTKDSLILANDFYKAEVYLDVPYYANPENLVLEAKIENSKNNKWERLSSRKFLIMGLEPGDYKLTIRALTSDKGDYIYKTLNISVNYLFYQTFFFRFLLVLFTLALVILVVKLKIRQQQLKNIVLEKIIKSRTEKLSETVKTLEITKERLINETKQQQKLLETISHDVITPAKYLSITTKKLYETEEKDYHKLKNYFEALYKSSEEFYNFIKTLKDYAEIYRLNNNESYETFLLNEIIDSKIMLFEEIAKSNNTLIYNHIKRDISITSNKNITSIIIHNLIDNAVKNTLCGFIDIFLEKTKEGTVIIIRDSGKGMTNEQMKYYNDMIENNTGGKLILQKYGLGLHLVLQLLIMINGELRFTKNSPKGTISTITIRKSLHE